MGFIRRNAKHFWVSFVFSISIFLAFPLSVYTQNVDMVRFSFEDILPTLTLFSIVGFAITSVLVIILSKRLKFIPLLLSALLVCLWVQGNFINYDLGSLDGQAIDWTASYKKIWIEILVWIAIIALFIIFRKKLLKNNQFILSFLLLLFTLPSAFMLIKESRDLPEKTYLDYSGEFNYSTKNVILIILDNFKTGVFEPILEKYPEYQDVFKDFVFYENAVGGYSTTLPSIPLILSGQHYQNLVPMNDFLSSIEETTISNQLREQGYAIESYAYVPFFSSIYDNHTHTMSFKDQVTTTTQQILVSGIRYSPLVLKPLFVASYYSGVDYVHKDIVTFNSRINEFEVTTDQPMFKLIHLSGGHYPYQLDGALNWTDSGYLEQTASSLVPVKNLLAELKNAGVYDDSLILIMSDHGGFSKQGYSTFPLQGQSQPLLLAKPAGQRSAQMQSSSAPVTLGDIPKTLATETGLDAEYPGYSIFESIPDNRIRYFYYYDWQQENWSTRYMPTLYEFKLQGPADLISSWEYTGQYSEGQFERAEDFEESDLFNTLMGR